MQRTRYIIFKFAFYVSVSVPDGLASVLAAHYQNGYWLVLFTPISLHFHEEGLCLRTMSVPSASLYSYLFLFALFVFFPYPFLYVTPVHSLIRFLTGWNTLLQWHSKLYMFCSALMSCHPWRLLIFFTQWYSPLLCISMPFVMAQNPYPNFLLYVYFFRQSVKTALLPS